jgi:hypothetical protein
MPAAVTYRDLVFREWWTREKGVANDQGICEIPVFLGKHRVSVSGVEHEVDVLDAGCRVRLETD